MHNMDKTQQIKADLEAYRTSKALNMTQDVTQNTDVARTGDINADLEAYRASKRTPEKKTTFAGDVIRGLVKPFVKVAAGVKAVREAAQGKEATGITSEYLGNVRPVGEGFDVTKGFTPENTKALKDSVGTGLDIASNIPIARGVGLAKTALTQPFKQTLVKSAKTLGKEGFVQGSLSGTGQALQDDKGFGETLVQGLVSGAVGTVAGGVLGAGGTAISRGLRKTPAEFISRQVDDSIKKVFSNSTGDIGKINDMAFKARKGLELLNKESSSIQIPDSRAHLGSNITKQFDITKSKPNELLSAVLEMDKKIVKNARQATEQASKQGFVLDTNEAKNIITDAVNSGDISPGVATKLYKQIDSTQGDPNKIFDWIQDVNVKYKKKYERGTIEDTMTGKLADDIAQKLRTSLNTITDRTGYAEAFSNNQELKRMLVSVAKKANKNINFGDITSDAGLDGAIALLTGNPAYMARTLTSTLFKGILNKIKNSEGIRAVTSASKNLKDIPTATKLPSLDLKQKRLLLPAPKEGTPQYSPFPMKGEKITTYEKPAQKIFNQNRIDSTLRLSAPKSNAQGLPIQLPESARETNLGIDSVKNANLALSKVNKSGDIFSRNLKTNKVNYNPNKLNALALPTLGLSGKKQNKDKKEFYDKERNVIIKKDDIDVLSPVLFGEISGRVTDKKELEARTILNTALNRVKEYKAKGKDKTLAEVLAMPNQYQAYGGKQYNLYKNNKLDYLGNKKKEEVDVIIKKLLKEIENGTFKDNTKNSYYYIHKPDGSIEFDSKRQLFSKN